MKARTVLIVDDERMILKTLQRLLKNEDYELIVAVSAKQGLALLAKHDVQVVITDYRMPGMLGDEFLEKVQKQYPRIRRIMLTGYPDARVVESVMESDVPCNIIFKPWDNAELKKMIRSHLARFDSASQDSDDA